MKPTDKVKIVNKNSIWFGYEGLIEKKSATNCWFVLFPKSTRIPFKESELEIIN